MNILILCLVVFLGCQAQMSCQCTFTPFQGLKYALISTNADWNTSNTACINCGAQMMNGMPSGVNQTFIEQTLGANTVAWSTAWVGPSGGAGGWCQFYTFKSNGKQFFGTNCAGSANYAICVKS